MHEHHRVQRIRGFITLFSCGLLGAAPGCGPAVSVVSVALDPAAIELSLESPQATRYVDVELLQTPDTMTNAWLSIEACIQRGGAGLQDCALTRSSTPSPFEEPDGWMNIVRTDNALAAFASTDIERAALYVGDNPQRTSESLVEEDETSAVRAYAVRFERGDLLQQASGIAPSLLHVNWNVTVNAWFDGEDENDLDASLLSGDFIRLQMREDP